MIRVTQTILMLGQKFCSIAGILLKGVQKTVGNLQAPVRAIHGGFRVYRSRPTPFIICCSGLGTSSRLIPRQQHLVEVDANKGFSAITRPRGSIIWGEPRVVTCSHQHSRFLQCGRYCSTMCNTAPNLGYNFDNSLDLVKPSLVFRR